MEYQRTIKQHQNKDIFKFKYYKLIITIRKKVNYGQAIYICGNILELGLWDVSTSIRLKWSDGHIWSGIILLTNLPEKQIQYKYAVADYSNPSKEKVQWETGSYNRTLTLSSSKSTIVLDDRWNMDKISLNLIVPQSQSKDYQQFYVVGDCPELGLWKDKKIMKKLMLKNQQKQNIDFSNGQQDSYLFNLTFYTFRIKETVKYYYIRQGISIQVQRKPGRLLNLIKPQAPHPYRKQVQRKNGSFQVYDYCSLSRLKISQITPRIYVGSYPKSLKDLQLLKQKKITSILSIQTEKDYASHGLTSNYIKQLCAEVGIQNQSYSIQDMNNSDFIARAKGALETMRDLCKKNERIYVHCSAGIYRSPQLIVLYLIFFQKFSYQEAINTVKWSHPFAQPNSGVIKKVADDLTYMKQKTKRDQKLYNCI